MVATKTKSAWLSKTIWVNGIATAVAVITAIAGQGWIADNPQIAAGLASAVYALNLVLRVLTTQPIVGGKR